MRNVALIVGAVIGLGGWLWIMSSSASRVFGAFEVDRTGRVVLYVYGYVLTLASAYLGSAYRRLVTLRAQHKKRIPKGFWRDTARSIEFGISICGSPVAFGLVMQTADGISLAGFTVVAIQNGFFCPLVVSLLQKEKFGSDNDQGTQ